ncbi:MAG TPA: hypothetical protein VIL46_14230 [Gemmataceae bacterium]
MNPTSAHLNDLLRRAGAGDPGARGELREELSRRLGPIVRHALRYRAGIPWVVNWVSEEVRPAPGGRGAPSAEQLCQRLSGELVRGLVPRDGPTGQAVAETVVGL